MTEGPQLSVRGLAIAVSILLMSASCLTSGAQDRPPIVQPGAPGESSQVITPAKAVDVSRVQATPADVEFMQGMIGHHQQAVEMTDLLFTRTGSDVMRKLGQRIQISQTDEIGMMQRWLAVRGQTVPDIHALHMHGATLMPGMLTPEEMDRLAAAKGRMFDRLFLEGMIKHHGGALTMVEELFSQPGAGQDSEIFTYASDVDADQRAEIERMSALLEELEK